MKFENSFLHVLKSIKESIGNLNITGLNTNVTLNLEGIEQIKGEQGLQGIQGIQGEKGEKGNNGLSAYEIWISLGNEGTEEYFLNSLGGASSGLGDGQRWKSVSRVPNNPYTNNTGKSIEFKIMTNESNYTKTIAIYCDGVLVEKGKISGSVICSVSAVIPQGATYYFTADCGYICTELS